MKRGEVYWLRYDNSWGHEQSVGRPVVILGGDEKRWGTDDPGTVIVAYTSTSAKSVSCNVPVFVGNRYTQVMCNQLGTVDGRRLTNLTGVLTDKEYEAVKAGLISMLDLDISQKEESESELELSKLKDENLNLKLELEIQKKMYDRVLGLLVDERINVDIKGYKSEPEVVDIPEPIEVDTELLEHQMSTPNVLMVEEDSSLEFKAKKRNPQYETVAASRLKERMDAAKRKMVGKKANINTATAEELMGAAGMGIGMARIIVKRRRDFGPYKDVSDLLNIHQLSDKMFVKYEPFLEV